MAHLNVEIKARCTEHQRIRDILKAHGAEFRGTDHQRDTYFQVPKGRLKLREGNIENTLIFYERETSTGPKQSHIALYQVDPHSTLKEILVKSHEILAVVDKVREIYFIENVKFHIDTVVDLGTFVEIEAIDYTSSVGKERLQEQCTFYLQKFGVLPHDLLAVSYSDLLFAHCT